VRAGGQPQKPSKLNSGHRQQTGWLARGQAGDDVGGAGQRGDH